MQLLYPAADGPVDLEALYAGDGDQVLRLNMVASLNGAVTVAGQSAGLSGPPDRHVFHLLRALADVVLVGAGTARAEGYRPSVVDAERRQRRLERGQRATPRIAVVSRSVGLPPDSPLLDPAAETVLVAPAAGLRDAEVPDGLHVIEAGERELDAAAALAALRDLGLRHVLCEGGPALNGALLSAGLVDELCLTTSAQVVGGPGPGVVSWPQPFVRPAVLRHLLLADGFLLGRWALQRGDQPGQPGSQVATR